MNDEKSNLVSAESYFRAGLAVAPYDHLLRNSLANCLLQQGGRDAEAGRHLDIAAREYLWDSKALYIQANRLVSQRRPRAALRRLDLALDRIQDRDLRPDAWQTVRAQTWDLRVQAARCACLCAERDMARHDNEMDRAWTRKHLPPAIKRLSVALAAARNHEPLQAMLRRAEELLDFSEGTAEGEKRQEETSTG